MLSGRLSQCISTSSQLSSRHDAWLVREFLLTYHPEGMLTKKLLVRMNVCTVQAHIFLSTETDYLMFSCTKGRQENLGHLYQVIKKYLGKFSVF